MTYPPDLIRLDLPASYAYLSILGACLDAFMERIDGLAEPRVTAYNVQLAVNEIFANIAGHAYEGIKHGRVAIEIVLASNPRRLLIELRDSGAAFDPSIVLEPDLEDIHIHGYGLFLVESLMDEVLYQRQPEGNRWHLVKYL